MKTINKEYGFNAVLEMIYNTVVTKRLPLKQNIFNGQIMQLFTVAPHSNMTGFNYSWICAEMQNIHIDKYSYLNDAPETALLPCTFLVKLRRLLNKCSSLERVGQYYNNVAWFRGGLTSI